jgi:hypothetical protein
MIVDLSLIRLIVIKPQRSRRTQRMFFSKSLGAFDLCGEIILSKKFARSFRNLKWSDRIKEQREQ